MLAGSSATAPEREFQSKLSRAFRAESGLLGHER